MILVGAGGGGGTLIVYRYTVVVTITTILDFMGVLRLPCNNDIATFDVIPVMVVSCHRNMG